MRREGSVTEGAFVADASSYRMRVTMMIDS